jgi:PAS domain S-box-containing protein
MKQFQRDEHAYRALFGPEDLAVFVMAQGIEDCNDAACRLLGLARERLIGCSPLAFSAPVQPDGTPSAEGGRRRVEAALAGQPQWFQWEFRREDGEPVVTLVHVEAVRLDATLRLLVNVRDLSPLWRAEASRRETETRLEQILDNASAVVFVKDPAGRYLFVNREFERVAGTPRGRIVGSTDLEVFPAGTAEHLRLNDRRVLDERRSIEFEEDVSLDGASRTYLASKFPLLRPDGEPYAVCGIATDISDRKRAEQALQRAALAVSSAGGANVFEELVRALAAILEVQAVLIAVFVDPGRSRMRTLATYVDGRILKTYEYELARTPCKEVVGREFRFSPSGVRAEFAPGTMFSELGFDSYSAYALTDAGGTQLGLIAAMDRRPMGSRELTEAMLKIFAVRAGAEVERARTEEALRRSEASYRSIFEANEDAVFVHDWETGQIVDVSPKAAETYGYTLAEMRRLTVADVSANEHPYTQEDAVRWIQRAKVTDGPLRFEWRGRHRDGHLMWHEVTLKRATIAGEPRILAFVRDITEHKATDEARAASAEQYRSIFNATADALVLRDADFRIVDVNPAYVAMSGYSRAEVVGAARVVANPPDINQYVKTLHGKALAGEAFHFETEGIRKDGSRFDVEVRGVPIQHQGKPHVLYIGRDITARKLADQALRTSEEQYRAVFQATMDGLVLRDADFRVVDVNPALLALTGHSRDEILGMDRWVFLPPGMHEEARVLHQRVIGGESIHYETEGVRKDGSRFDVEVRCVPIQYRGRPHALAMARDITARRRAEEERAQLEAQLRQAQKMEAIGHLTGGIAHDFNNILTSVMGYLVLAAEREGAQEDAKLAKYLSQAHLSCERARDLIQQMLTFSRGQRGERRPTALGALVKESVKLLRSTMPATLELVTEIDAEAPQVMLDPVQTDQVLLNLGINARDATEGHGAVTVGVRRASGDGLVCASCRKRIAGDFVELVVRDTGPGIAPEVMERMFEPFFSTKEVGKGSGMGLATVHGIVHEHGGHIVVETQPGRGASFRVLFPTLPQDEAAARPARRARAGAAAPRIELAGHVMVVDDEAMVSEFMKELLESWGLAVTAKPNGVEAREAFARTPELYDLVVTDQAMPRITGLQLARELLEIRPTVPVILYTGYADDLTEAQAHAAGVRALIRKPVEPAALLALLQAHLPSGAHAVR